MCLAEHPSPVSHPTCCNGERGHLHRDLQHLRKQVLATVAVKEEHLIAALQIRNRVGGVCRTAGAVPPEKARSYIAQIRQQLAQRKDTP